MTREEATIQALQGHIEALNETIEKQEKAIKALEQQPSEDCVSRQAVVEYIKASDADLGHDSENEFVVEDILDMPPVTPICKVGKWTNGNPICPCCGEDKFKDLDADIWADWQPRYCPNCGARIMEDEV